MILKQIGSGIERTHTSSRRDIAWREQHRQSPQLTLTRKKRISAGEPRQPGRSIEGCTADETTERIKALAAAIGAVNPCTSRKATPEELAALDSVKPYRQSEWVVSPWQ